MRIIRNSPLGEGNSRKKEIGLMKIYAGSNGRTRHPRGKGRYAVGLFYIPRLDITQPLSFFSRWLFLKNLRKERCYDRRPCSLPITGMTRRASRKRRETFNPWDSRSGSINQTGTLKN